MPTQTQFINHVRFIDRVIKNKTNGLTHADSMKQLPFPANCMNWNLGHILILHENEPRVIAVLDWELSTLGDPLGDFTYYLMNWVMPHDGPGRGEAPGGGSGGPSHCADRWQADRPQR